jgi:hypothetical protein
MYWIIHIEWNDSWNAVEDTLKYWSIIHMLIREFIFNKLPSTENGKKLYSKVESYRAARCITSINHLHEYINIIFSKDGAVNAGTILRNKYNPLC